MKKLLALILFFVFTLVFLTGCETNNANQVAKKDKIYSDISGIEELKKCFTSDFVYESDFVCKDFEIIKRQTNKEDKEDLVFLNVTMENEYFEIDMDMDLVYNFYDEGGWILDEYNWDIKDVIPVRGPEPNLIINRVTEDDDSGTYANVTLNNGETYSWVVCNNITTNSKSDLLIYGENDKISGAYINYMIDFEYFRGNTYCILEFLSGFGWKLSNSNIYEREPALILDEIIDDFVGEEMSGTFQYTYEIESWPMGGEPVEKEMKSTLVVSNVDFLNGKFTCTWLTEYNNYFRWRDEYKSGSYYEDDIKSRDIKMNPFNLNISCCDLDEDCSDYFKHNELWYNAETNCWEWDASYVGGNWLFQKVSNDLYA